VRKEEELFGGRHSMWGSEKARGKRLAVKKWRSERKVGGDESGKGNGVESGDGGYS
jgi:hypothetical protein